MIEQHWEFGQMVLASHLTQMLSLTLPRLIDQYQTRTSLRSRRHQPLLSAVAVRDQDPTCNSKERAGRTNPITMLR